MSNNRPILRFPLAVDLAKEVCGKNWDSFDDKKQGQIINLIYEFAIKHQAAITEYYTDVLKKMKSIADEGIENSEVTQSNNP